MKTEYISPESYKPVTITLETQEEFDVLSGLLRNGALRENGGFLDKLWVFLYNSPNYSTDGSGIVYSQIAKRIRKEYGDSSLLI